MAQQPTNARIEELRGRLKADPKSRLFYPLAEELRKIGRYEEAEKALRDGLAIHSSYLSAWISLGRVLKDVGNNREATEVLGKALQLDMGNVVAARLAAEAYLALGEKVEAVKKYKLVRALMPGDQAIEEQIERLERELEPEEYADVPPGVAPGATAAPESEAVAPFEVSETESPVAFEEGAPFAETGPGPSESVAAAPSSEGGEAFGEPALPESNAGLEHAPGEQPQAAAEHEQPVADLFETAAPMDFDDTARANLFPRPATIEREVTETAEETTAFEGEEPVSKYGGVVAESEVAETAEPEPPQDDFETMIGSTAELEEPSSTGTMPASHHLETVEIAAPERKAELADRLNRWLARVGRSEAGNV